MDSISKLRGLLEVRKHIRDSLKLGILDPAVTAQLKLSLDQCDHALDNECSMSLTGRWMLYAGVPAKDAAILLVGVSGKAFGNINSVDDFLQFVGLIPHTKFHIQATKAIRRIGKKFFEVEVPSEYHVDTLCKYEELIADGKDEISAINLSIKYIEKKFATDLYNKMKEEEIYNGKKEY